MEVLKETDRRFVNIQRKVGFFVLAAVVGIIAVLILIGMRQDFFTPKVSIYFTADSGYDISEGQAVKLIGFKIGRVRKISLEENATVKVELSINRQYMKWIKTDSRATLKKEGFIGDSIIEITPGSPNAGEAAGEVVIPFSRDKGIAEIAGELKNEITPALKDLRQIMAYINDPDGDIKQTIRNIRTVSKDMSTTRQNLDSLLVNTDKNITGVLKKVDSAADSARQTLSNTDAVIKKIDKDMPGLLDKADRSLGNIQKTTEEIRKATEQAAPRIPAIVEKGGEAAEDAKEVTGSLKKMWPLRLFIDQPKEQKLKVDSYE